MLPVATLANNNWQQLVNTAQALFDGSTTPPPPPSAQKPALVQREDSDSDSDADADTNVDVLLAI
jgi:hypothetical protein